MKYCKSAVHRAIILMGNSAMISNRTNITVYRTRPIIVNILRKKLLQKQFPNATDKQLQEMYDEVDDQLEKEKTVANRGLDPGMDPDMDPGRFESERDPSARGPGGGARRPGGGPPTRPTTQQADGADREADDARPSR